MLEIRPCHIREAREYVKEHHRHNIPPVGGKFAVACYDGERLCGVAICGRPVSRHSDNGTTLEILRCWLMDLKLLLKVSLCIIQFVFLYRVLRHDDYYLAPIQLLIAALVGAI